MEDPNGNIGSHLETLRRVHHNQVYSKRNMMMKVPLSADGSTPAMTATIEDKSNISDDMHVTSIIPNRSPGRSSPVNLKKRRLSTTRTTYLANAIHRNTDLPSARVGESSHASESGRPLRSRARPSLHAKSEMPELLESMSAAGSFVVVRHGGKVRFADTMPY